MRLNSPLKPIVNHQLSKLIQGGVIARNKKSYMGLDQMGKDFCGEENEDIEQTSLSDVGVLFWLIGTGVVGSVLVAYFECISKMITEFSMVKNPD